MPSLCRRLARRPILLDLPSDQSVPFSRLTLTAQLEVLAIPPEQSWAACIRDNPLLRRWRALAQSGRLEADAVAQRRRKNPAAELTRRVSGTR